MTIQYRAAQVMLTWVAPLLLAGCANGLPGGAAPPPATGIDGQACVGRLADPGAGLIESSNPVLLERVRLASGQGGTCEARVYAVTQPVTLYRLFDAAKPHTRLGGWWALTPPSGTREAYRASYAICPEWSALDRVVACELRPGSQVVVGSTQSAVCADGSTLPRTAAPQVFVANDGRAGINHMGACRDEAPWP
jgi:hypothetical protein